MNDNIEIEEIKKETENIISDFTTEIANHIEEISRFKTGDLDKLLKMIFNNCIDLLELKKYHDELKNYIKLSKLIGMIFIHLIDSVNYI